jgi:hypothetical protein
MNQKLFVFITVFCAVPLLLPLRAQQPVSPFKDSCEWSVSRYKFRTMGSDTLKDDKIWLKVYRDQSNTPFSFDAGRAELYALVRYDSAEKRLYGMHPSNSAGNEFLMYDFSMKVGDTVDVVSYKRTLEGRDLSMKAIRIGPANDSVTLSNGEKRAILHMQMYNPEEPWNQLFKSVWIEGIGSDFGLFSPDYGSSYSCRYERLVLLCYAENGETLLELPENDINDSVKGDCFNSDMGLKVPETCSKSSVEVFPNPASGQIWLRDAQGTLQSLQVFNAVGQEVLRQNLEGSEQVVNISTLAKGVYFLKIGTDRATVMRKIVVE